MIKELEQYLKDKIELESEVLSLKDTVHNQNRTIRNLKKRLEDEHPRVEIIKKNLTYYIGIRKPIDWNMIKTRLGRIHDLLRNHAISIAEMDLRYLCEYLYIQKEEHIEEESFINLEEVEKRIESKLEKKYEKELQKLSTLTTHMKESRRQVDEYRREKYKLEEAMNKTCEELYSCYDNLDIRNAELDELRSHHNKLKNHWLVKLLRVINYMKN